MRVRLVAYCAAALMMALTGRVPAQAPPAGPLPVIEPLPAVSPRARLEPPGVDNTSSARMGDNPAPVQPPATPAAAIVETLPPGSFPKKAEEPVKTLPESAPEVLPPDAALIEGPLLEAPPPVKPPPKIWEGGLEFGINGSEGNSEVFNFRFLTNGKRTTDDNIFSFNTRYIKNSAGSVETANRLFGEARDEWLFDDSPWTLYVHGTGEYDEFRAFDVRITGDAGLGYQFLKNDSMSLLGRAGPGFSQEIGGPDDSIVPEAVFGLAYEYQITEFTKFNASADYFPDISDVNDFRLNTQANWEMLLDKALHLSLKLGVLDRYDSTPNGAKPNDLDYSATILWSF